MSNARYVAVMERGEGGGFGVWFPDLPGCVSAGDSEAEARANAVEALGLHLEGMAEDGFEAPKASGLDAIGPEDMGEGGLYLFVVDAPDAAASAPAMARVNVMLAAPLLQRIDRAADVTHHGNRSAWLSDAARAFIAGRR